MKIKLALFDTDTNYLNRLANVFTNMFSDKLELYTFTDLNIALSNLSEKKIDVFVACDSVEIDTAQLPKKCGFAYFVDSVDVERAYNQRTVCKFQKAELIYKQILNIFSEISADSLEIHLDNDDCKLLVFSSPAGGTGTSTAAAACAMQIAQSRKRAMYLNLETFGMSEAFFQGEGQYDMGDIIFALKKRKSNLILKLESDLRHDVSGVYFYAGCKVALDMLSIEPEDSQRLVVELKSAGLFDYLILDIPFSLSKDRLQLFSLANALVWVCDGRENANLKTSRTFTALQIAEQNEGIRILDRTYLLYNKFSNKSSVLLENVDLIELGGMSRVENATNAQIAEAFCKKNVFDKIL